MPPCSLVCSLFRLYQTGRGMFRFGPIIIGLFSPSVLKICEMRLASQTSEDESAALPAAVAAVKRSLTHARVDGMCTSKVGFTPDRGRDRPPSRLPSFLPSSIFPPPLATWHVVKGASDTPVRHPILHSLQDAALIASGTFSPPLATLGPNEGGTLQPSKNRE